MYIALEGIDGCGKSTQIQLLKKLYPKILLVTEPSKKLIGSIIRQQLAKKIISDPLLKDEMVRLFSADRTRQLRKKILPALKAGMTVVSDRCLLSSVAYLDPLQTAYTHQNLRLPDHTIWFKLAPVTALERIVKRKASLESTEALESLRRAHGRYEEMAPLIEFHIIDASRSISDVAQDLVFTLDWILQEGRYRSYLIQNYLDNLMDNDTRATHQSL